MRKVLVIDDNSSNIQLIYEILKKYLPDILLLEALSGTLGIQVAQNENPDAILLDIMMPEMDGFEVCTLIKSNPETKHIPILLISAIIFDSASITKGLNLGADAFLVKPINPAELVAQLKVVLRIKHAENQLRKEIYKYKVMTKTLPDAVATVNLNNEITYSSTQASVLFGYQQSDDLLNRNILGLFHPDEREKARKCLTGIYKDSLIKDLNFRFIRNDATEFMGELSGSLIINDRGEPDELIIVIRDITKRNQSEKALLDYQQKLKTLNLLLILAEEKERKIIAETLHDGLGQILAIIKMKLTSLANEAQLSKCIDVVNESIILLSEAIQETKSLTYDISSPILYELGLQAALKWKLAQTQKKYQIKTLFKTNFEEKLLKNDISIMLYRIVSELLINSVKHAKASLITTELTKDENFITVNFADNGIGYNPENGLDLLHNGFGLFNIRERIDGIQGSFKIDSQPGKGTLIQIKIPIINK